MNKRSILLQFKRYTLPVKKETTLIRLDYKRTKTKQYQHVRILFLHKQNQTQTDLI